MEDNASDFVKRLFGFSIGPIIAAFLGFIMTPLTTWLIVPEEFGKASMYSMAFSLSSLFIYLGIDQAFIREYSAEKNKINLFWNCFLIPFTFSLFVAVLYLIFWELISYTLFESHEKFIIYTLAISLPVAVFQRFNLVLIRMQERAKLYSFFIVLERIINLPLLVLLLIVFERSFKSIIFAQFFSLLLIGLTSLLINKQYWFSKFSINKVIMFKLLKYGLPLVPAAIFSWVLNSMDKMALRTWADFSELGLYSAAFKIVMVLEIVKTSFTTFWSPTAYRWHESGVSNERFVKVSKTLSTILFILFSLIVIFKDVIILILNRSYREAVVIVPFLLFLPMMYTISETTKVGINFSRKTSYNILVTGLVGIINFLGNYILVPTLGGLGASISTGISYIAYFWISTLISRKLWFKFDLKFYFINILLMISLASVSVFYNYKIIEILIFGLVIVYNHSHLGYLCNVGMDFIIELRTKVFNHSFLK